MPAFVLKRGPVSDRALGALMSDPRVEVIVAKDTRTNWAAAAQRAALVLVISNEDPLSTLLYAITAGITIPLVIAMPRRFANRKRDVIGAGAAACVTMPIAKADVSRMVKLFTKPATGLQVDGKLHLVLDPIGRVLRMHAKSVQLSQREFAVLHCLIGRSGRPVSATDVLATVWGDQPGRVQSREILDVYIFNLRKKLKRLGLPNAIRTVRSYGYVLEAPDATVEL